MKKKTVISIACALCWLLAAYSAYAFVYFAWLTATPLIEGRLEKIQFYAMAWLIVLGASLAAALLLGWWRLRLAGFLMFRRRESKS